MEPNPGGAAAAVELQRPISSRIYEGQPHFTAAPKRLRVIFNFLCSPTAAVIASALLMMLIGWIDLPGVFLTAHASTETLTRAVDLGRVRLFAETVHCA